MSARPSTIAAVQRLEASDQAHFAQQTGDTITKETINVPTDEALPWLDADLIGWDICGMNHYHMSGERLLFVAITRGGVCLRAEGHDATVWKMLRVAVRAHQHPVVGHMGDLSHQPGDGA
jgi:hypothetical protein